MTREIEPSGSQRDQEEPLLVGRLQECLTGSWMTQALCAAAELGVADLLEKGPRTSGALADATGAHEPSLRRLLLALGTIDVVREREDGSFEATALGALLARNHPHSLHAWVVWWGRHLWPVWGNLLYSVRTGRSARTLLQGTEGFAHLDQDPEGAAVFYQVTVELTRLSAASVVRACDFSRFRLIVDVGGGHGALLAAILEQWATPAGILFDTPSAIAGAVAHFEQAHPGIGARCGFHPGDFFESVPDGADAYILKSVIHDWDDARSARILATCRRAMSLDSRLLIIEQILPERRDASPLHQMLSRHDLTMLVACGAQERTEAEYRRLLASSGFDTTCVVPAGPSFSVIEARPIASS